VRAVSSILYGAVAGAPPADKKPMNNHDPASEERALSALLQEWKPSAALPPRFQEQVWRHIGRADALPAPTITLWQLFLAWLETRLPRPALATSYVVALLVIGATVGWTQARQESSRVTTKLSARYAQMVDPYQSAP
jgi:hypothetical protein